MRSRSGRRRISSCIDWRSSLSSSAALGSMSSSPTSGRGSAAFVAMRWSSGPTVATAIVASHFWNSACVTWSSVAISSSVGARFNWCSSFVMGGFDRARPCAHGPRHPVEGPQAVEDGAVDAWMANRLELRTSRRVEPVECVHEAEHTGQNEVTRVDAGGKSCGETTGDELHDRRVVHDQLFAGVCLSLLSYEFSHAAVRAGVRSLVLMREGWAVAYTERSRSLLTWV